MCSDHVMDFPTGESAFYDDSEDCGFVDDVSACVSSSIEDGDCPKCGLSSDYTSHRCDPLFQRFLATISVSTEQQDMIGSSTTLIHPGNKLGKEQDGIVQDTHSVYPAIPFDNITDLNKHKQLDGSSYMRPKRGQGIPIKKIDFGQEYMNRKHCVAEGSDVVSLGLEPNSIPASRSLQSKKKCDKTVDHETTKGRCVHSSSKSYNKLYELMERTAKSRIVLLKISSTVASMRSFPDSVSHTIFSSIKLTLETSAQSLERNNAGPDTFDTKTCDMTNSTFEETIDDFGKESKQQYPAQPSFIASTLTRSRSSSMKSLPSCGSLEREFAGG
eukprot:jgi/Psemu1/24818/gm1.24818_g